MAISHTDTSNVGTRGVPAASSTRAIHVVALVLLIIGGLNWGLVGLFNVDLVATIFGSMTTAARAVYAVVGLAALWGIVTTVQVARREAA